MTSNVLMIENQEKALSNSSLLPFANELLKLFNNIENFLLDHSLDSRKQLLCYQINAFENNAKQSGVPALKILTARYILCSALDEFILQSNWGKLNRWCDHSLLSFFHNDTQGGERLYTLLDKALKEKKQYWDILELIYFCLALGFSGKYRVLEQGEEKLVRLRMELYALLQAEKPSQPLTLHTIKKQTPSPSYAFFGFKNLITSIAAGIILISSYCVIEHNINIKSTALAHELIVNNPTTY